MEKHVQWLIWFIVTATSWVSIQMMLKNHHISQSTSSFERQDMDNVFQIWCILAVVGLQQSSTWRCLKNLEVQGMMRFYNYKLTSIQIPTSSPQQLFLLNSFQWNLACTAIVERETCHLLLRKQRSWDTKLDVTNIYFVSHKDSR